MYKNFSLKKAYSYGFWAFFEHIGFFFKFSCISALILFCSFIIVSIPLVLVLMPSQMRAVIVGHAVIFALLLYAQWHATLLQAVLSIYDMHEATIAQAYETFKTKCGLRLAFFYTSYMILDFLGYTIGIVPGIFIDMLYGFSFFFMLDNHMGMSEALRASVRLGRGVRGKLFGFYALLYIFALPLNATLIGLAFTLPMSLLARVYVYRQLLEGSSSIKS